MYAILVNDDQSLSWSQVPTPSPKADEVLLKIKAAGINRADLMQRAGDYPPPADCPPWMGLEVSGVVEKAGAEVKNWKIGDAACALLGGGGYAEYVCVKEDMLMPVPKGLTVVEAAALPEAFATSFVNLRLEAKIEAGQTILITGGNSGLAGVMIPMAKSLGAKVITTVRSDEKAEAIKGLGADIIVNTKKESLEEVLKNNPIDAAVDCIGGSDVGTYLNYMNRGGRWIMIAALAGSETTVDLKLLYKKNIYLSGNTLRARTPAAKAEILAKLVREIWPLIENGSMKPSIYRILPIMQADEGQALLSRGESIGKVILTVGE